MGMTQQDRQVLTQNWDQAKDQVASKFPGLQPTALGQGPDAEKIAQITGQDRSHVETVLADIARQYND